MMECQGISVTRVSTWYFLRAWSVKEGGPHIGFTYEAAQKVFVIQSKQLRETYEKVN